MPGGAANRPVAPADPDPPALDAAMRQARERAAAPVPPGRVPDPEAPGTTPRVEEVRPAVGAVVQGDPRGARSHRLAPRRRRKTKDTPAGPDAPDPRGRGGRLDLRV
ncbi:MAG TPA: hypothetical protein VE981_02420 [Planctomycetota bacterium]|nr:hypothetical protein [Planctomycetota bacterium]